VEHLSQEELLLLADGELGAERASHLDACAACRAVAGATQGQLTAITAALRAGTRQETPEMHSASWARLRHAIRGDGGSVAVHLSPGELVLHIDEELAPERALHLEACESCHDELLRVQALLFDIEHELRALIPAEPRERRLAAAQALEEALYPPKKVISFPVRWGAVYAAAATLTFAVFGGLWTSHRQIEAPRQPAAVALQTPATVEAPAPQTNPTPSPAAVRVERPGEPAAILASVQPLEAQAEESAPAERYQAVWPGEPVAPERAALSGDGFAGRMPPAPPSEIALGLSIPAVAEPQPAVTAAAPKTREPRDPNLMLAGLQAVARSGAWMADIHPEVRDGKLTFSGRVSSPSRRDEVIAALTGQPGAKGADFDIAIAAPAVETAEAGVSFYLGDRPAGGMMRSALVAHYEDAARRSFQQPTQSALDAEIARFAGEVYRSQSKLVRHAHALDGLLQEFELTGLSPDALKTLDSLVRFHAEGVAEGETRIYDALSEALPRRYWNHRGDRQATADPGPAAAAHDLLADALRLDETLTTLLGSSAGSVDVRETETSAGALLYRIRTRARNLTSGLDSTH
jgi:hypothetical protein